MFVEETRTGRFMFGLAVNSDAGVTGNITVDVLLSSAASANVSESAYRLFAERAPSSHFRKHRIASR